MPMMRGSSLAERKKSRGLNDIKEELCKLRLEVAALKSKLATVEIVRYGKDKAKD